MITISLVIGKGKVLYCKVLPDRDRHLTDLYDFAKVAQGKIFSYAAVSH